MTSALLLALVACGERQAERPDGVDTLSDRQIPDSLQESDCGPCGCDDPECDDSLRQANEMRGLMAAPKQLRSLSLAAVAQSYTADSSKYRIRYAVSRALNTGETLYVRLRRDTTGGNVAINEVRKRRTQRDSADFVVNKVFGKAAAYSALLQYKRNMGSLTTLQTQRWTTNFPTPVDTTPPGVDTLIVDSAMALLMKPDNADITKEMWSSKGIFYQDSATGTLYDSLKRPLPFKCPSGGDKCPQVQFCTFVVFGDSNIVMRAADRDKPACQGFYQQFPTQRTTDVRAKQQQKADAMCVKYTATGGTITSEECGVPS